MAVYYKFKSAKDYDSIPIEGQFISLANLKERIFEIKLFGKGTDFDLMISNAQNNEEYVDEGAMIPKNTSVLIRRVPGRPRKPIVTGIEETKVVEDKVEDLPPSSSMLVGDSSTTKYPEEYEWDEFGNDLYAVPEVNPAQASNPVLDVSPANMVDEDSKIKALIDTPALDWNRQTQEGYGSGRGFGRGSGSRMMGGRGFGRGMLERKTPPAGYVCHRCKVPGHFIQHCPTNGDPNYDIKRVKPPTGIPKSMLMATPDGSYALPSGAAAVLKPNEAAFEKEIEGLPTTRPVSDLPPELRCPLCKEVMKDAVLTSKCCFRSFCDKCIRDYIITKLMCICGATNILADDLLPNKTLRETISRILESTTSSTENAGSLVQVQDMESARPLQPKVPSPTYSVASKDEPMQHTVEQSSHMKEGEVASEVKATNNDMNSSDKKAIINTPASEDVPESLSMKGPKSFESAPVPEDAQEKQLAGEQAADMQWRSYQDLGAENYGMPLPPPGYNPHWSGGMPMGVDGYMAPFGGAMPFMGYTPGPFDIPYGGGIFPQDPYVAQGFMMPAVPRDLSELNMGSMGMNQNQGPSGMSRDDFGARKAADLRRKREMERLRERERAQSKDRDARRESSSMNDASSSSMRTKPTATSQSDRSDRHRDRERDRSEKTASVDRHGPPRDPPRHSPPRPRQRKAADHDEPLSDAERKHKASVFSRISFPDPGEGTNKKKKKPSSSELPPRNGLKEPTSHKTGPEGHRDEPKGGKSSSTSTRKGGSGYDHDSSEEEYHFKRRPSSSSRREATKADHREEVAPRPSKRSREREPHERGGRERAHGHERPASRRR
ncbi:E3 ubiquitin ligase PQT3-like isoform X2 [Musa acuminata AAA Group]|uniref:E3 ubiquitin ligase PQT3-like isoform X2 n=1 Tax=Musa acuminata AAA Group TaxID=214697 RepID=UPI0031CEE742